MKKSLSVVLFFIIGFGLMMVQGCSVLNQPVGLFGPVSQQVKNKDSAISLYHEAWQLVRDEYVDPRQNGQDWYRWEHKYDKVLKTQDDAYAAINTMLASLNDPYSRFLDPRRAEDQNMHIDSRLFGVGIQIAEKDNQILVIAPIEDSPAEKAGVRPLDRIMRINDEPIADMEIDDVVDRIRGPKGTPVTVTFLRDGKEKTFKLIRDEIVIKSVFGDPVSKDIGYIRLSSFISQDASAEMRKKLMSQNKTKAMILDLRGNNGGLLPNALEISDMFLKGGKIVSVVDRNGVQKVFEDQPAQLYDRPLVLLIDGGSASASEILSGALKDNDRATLIGTKTFGKGLVQKINYLEDGSEMNLTISKYYTPGGHDIDKKGIAPDILVDFTMDDMKHDRDPQKARAIQFLKEQLLADAS
jgi:carboxyl-terminal processing protease